MRRETVWRGLTAVSLGVAVVMAVLGMLALVLSQALAAAAAGLCAVMFFVPGLFFLNYARRLAARDLALAHVAKLAEDRGVTDAEAMGKELEMPTKDAERILRKAIEEGHLAGELDAAGRFVSARAPRCPSCSAPHARNAAGSACPRCGATLPGG